MASEEQVLQQWGREHQVKRKEKEKKTTCPTVLSITFPARAQNTGIYTHADPFRRRFPSLIALQHISVFMRFLSRYADKWQRDQTVKSKKTTAI